MVLTAPLLLLLSHGALMLPSSSRGGEIGRRSVLAAVGLAAPLSLIVRPHGAVAFADEFKEAALAKARAREGAVESAKVADDRLDPLTLRLQQSRAELSNCYETLEARQWDKARQVISRLLPLMTFRGYTGESVIRLQQLA